jgi:class 3 adenylate cyclase/tetratricopeptide (TPR) repeat protein
VAEARLQRKLAAILATDVVGYSRLMGADEAGTLARLNILRRDLIDPTIAAHSGRTIKLMGDGSLVEFASIVDAVGCALQIQDRIREGSDDELEGEKIQLRIGVNVGDVIVDGDDIYGDGVNVAARIEALADPGGVFVSRGAADEVRGKLPIRLENRGLRNVKNIARPIEVFAARWDDRRIGKRGLGEGEEAEDRTLPHWPPDRERDRAPYRGLKPLDSVDAAIFFGRDAPIAEAMDRLGELTLSADKRLLVILAASGAGKSSFLRAGLLPRLAMDARRFQPLPVLRPERNALFGENGLLGALEASLPTRTRAELRAAIRSGADALRALLRENFGKPRAQSAIGDNSVKRPAIVLAIDQAEELFRADGGVEGAALLGLIRDLVCADEPRFIIIFTIRSDSYDALQRAKPLEGLAQSTLPLLPLPRSAYKEVIEGPARCFANAGGKLAIEPQLTERLLEDLDSGVGGDALPLLAFTLEQLFLEYRRSGALKLANYIEFGGLKGAIDAAVERAFSRADADARIPKDRKSRETLLRRGVIPWLAGIDPDSKKPRRNIARRSDIPEEARPLIDLLVEERLLATDTLVATDPETGAKTRYVTIEPAHEALLRQWGLLEGWMAEDFGRLATLEGIKRAARDWESNAMAEGWLAHQGLRLAEARALDARPDLAAQLAPRDRAYLERCGAREAAIQAERDRARANELARTKAEAERARAEAERASEQARHSRQLARVVGLAASIFAIVAAVSVALGIIARREATRAEESFQVARQAADSLVVEIAQGLRGVEGMPTASVRRILESARTVVERLASAAPDDLDLAKSRVQMQQQFAINYSALGDLGGAMEFAAASVKGARQILASAGDDKSKALLGFSLLSLARVQKLHGDADAAHAAIDEAIDLSGEMTAAPSNTLAARIKVRALLSRSDLAVTRGDTARGLEDARSAVDTGRPLSQAEPADKELQTLLADALERSGNIAGGINTAFATPRRLDPALPPISEGIDNVAALAAYEESARIFRRQVAEDSTDSDARGRLENILIRVGDLNLSTGKLDAALATHKEALTISNELLSADSGNSDWRRRVEVNHQKLVSVYMARGDFDEALAQSKEAADIGKRLYDLDPQNLLWRRDFCGRWRSLGLVLRAKKDAAAARENLDKAVTVCRETASRHPDDPEVRIELALSYYLAGRDLAPVEAAPLFRNALAELEGLERRGELPKANSNWVEFIREKLAAAEAAGAAK